MAGISIIETSMFNVWLLQEASHSSMGLRHLFPPPVVGHYDARIAKGQFDFGQCFGWVLSLLLVPEWWAALFQMARGKFTQLDDETQSGGRREAPHRSASSASRGKTSRQYQKP
jgi:hypothetical protein